MFDSLPTVKEYDSSLPGTLELGAFSISLSVANLDASREFYETLGFEVTGGNGDHGYLIMKNGATTIGLFHGMFEGNILTFNPGLTERMERIESFTDVRKIEEHVLNAGVTPVEKVSEDAGDSGAAHIRLVDPDGNAILIDQFF